MTWFETVPEKFEAKQWPAAGLTGLAGLVGEDRLIQADDGTMYVIVTGGYPQRVELGWWVLRWEDGDVGVSSERYRSSWRETNAPR